MSELRVYISTDWRDAESACPWVLLDEQGAIQQYGEAPFARMPKGHDCHIVVAADRVLNVTATLPPGGRRRWQAILPFAVEEYSLADPDDNHVVPGAAMPDGRHQLYVVDKSWLRRIVATVQQAGIYLRNMVSEAFIPGLERNHWTLVWDGNSGFVTTSKNQGLALDCGDVHAAPLALKLALSNAPSMPESISFRPVHDAAGALYELPQWQDVPVPLKVSSAWDWRREKISEDAVNLLWGEFAPRARIQAWWPRLRPAMWLLLAIFLVEVAGSNLQWFKLVIERNRISRDMQKTFRATFGDDVTLVNAPLQMQRNLARLRHAAGLPDSGDFLPLLNQATPALSALPEGSVTGMHFESAKLDIDIRLQRKEGFNVLKQSIQDSGLGVRIGEARDLGNAVEAKVTVMPGGLQ